MSRFEKLAGIIENWFRHNARVLPWRTDYDPYKVWVAEIMLQQTQVKKVIPFFLRFVERFPTLAELAGASEREVLLHWAGLGYYSRARNLLKGVQTVRKLYRGRVPSEIPQLMELPGIGRYTAGAIASIAYNQPEPLVDGNVIRLLSRLFAVEEHPEKPTGKAKLWSLATSLVNSATPRLLNQGLMELGALICTPQKPQCPACPLRRLCKARRLKRTEQYPRRSESSETLKIHETFLVISRRGRYLLVQRGRGVSYQGLWEFPREESLSTESLQKGKEPLGVLNYRIMNRQVEAHFFSAEFEGAFALLCPYVDSRWLTLRQSQRYPVPAPIRKLISTLLKEVHTAVDGP